MGRMGQVHVFSVGVRMKEKNNKVKEEKKVKEVTRDPRKRARLFTCLFIRLKRKRKEQKKD